MTDPHFHKDYKINEADLIPNGQIYDSLPESAQEGSRVVVEDPAGTFTVYYYLKGAWRKVGASGFTLKTYQTVNANNLVITDLDLDTDGIYKIFVKTRDSTVPGTTISMTVNNDSSLSYYTHETIGGAATNFNGNSVGLINSITGTPSQFESEILLTKKSGERPLLQYSTSGVNTDSPVQYPNLAIGSATYDSTTNITSLEFFHPGGINVSTWDIWIYKLETS